MVQLNHYQTLDKMKTTALNSELYLFVCGISAENLGLILRSADIFGAKKIIYHGNETDRAQKIRKLSRNAAVEVEYTDDYEILDTLKKQGYRILALEITDTAEPLNKIVFGDKTCLVVGNEQHGISQDILDKCDKSYYIEMISKNISSLNVAVATSIALNKFLESNL